jgi:hypothetical protein
VVIEICIKYPRGELEWKPLVPSENLYFQPRASKAQKNDPFRAAPACSWLLVASPVPAQRHRGIIKALYRAGAVYYNTANPGFEVLAEVEVGDAVLSYSYCILHQCLSFKLPPGVFNTYFYNHAHRLRLEKLL